MAYNKLFEKGKIGKLTVKNRGVMMPMGTVFSEPDGSVNERIIEYYAERAKGGIGLIINEYTGVDDVDGLVFHMGTKMTDEGLVTDGGRVLMVVTLEDDLQTAFDHTYKELEKIQCKDLFHRNDIGKKDM